MRKSYFEPAAEFFDRSSVPKEIADLWDEWRELDADTARLVRAAVSSRSPRQLRLAWEMLRRGPSWRGLCDKPDRRTRRVQSGTAGREHRKRFHPAAARRMGITTGLAATSTVANRGGSRSNAGRYPDSLDKRHKSGLPRYLTDQRTVAPAPPRPPVRGSAFQAAIAASVNQTVRLPRWRRAASYAAQFVTRCRCLGMWRRQAALALNGTAGVRIVREGGDPGVVTASNRSDSGARPTTTRFGLETGAFLSADEALKLPDFA